MKFNVAIFKRGTMWWVLGGIAFFVLVWWMLSRGASTSSGGGTAYVQSGPSEAAQIQMATLGAQTSLAQMQIGSEATKAALESQTQIALATLAASSEDKANQLGYNAALAQIDANAEANAMGYQYNLETARLASATTLDMANVSRAAQKDLLDQQVQLSGINASVLLSQMDTQAEMFAKQIDAATFQQALNIVPSLKKGDRDNALISLLTGKPSSHGSILPGYSVPAPIPLPNYNPGPTA